LNSFDSFGHPGVMKMRQLCLLAEDVNANQAKELKLLGWVHCYVPLAMLLIPKFEGSMIHDSDCVWYH